MTLTQLFLTDPAASAAIATLAVIASAFVVFLCKDNARQSELARQEQAQQETLAQYFANSEKRLTQQNAAAQARMVELSAELGFQVGKGE